MEQSQSYWNAFMPVLDPIVVIEAVLTATSPSAAMVHSEMDPLNKGHLCIKDSWFTNTCIIWDTSE